jgi:arylamine N-acetyltransferase
MLERAACDRYLAILGLRERPPSREALAALVRSHLQRVPFENVSKLYHRHVRRRTDLVDVETYLHDIERYRFGGTCYALNYGLYRLLGGLGYRVRLCGAAMSAPDVHLAIIATVDGADYLLDVGYGGPFFAPVPLGAAERRVISSGRDRYEFWTDPAPRLDHFRDGEFRHGYTVNPAAREIGEFREVIASSFDEGATFMNALLVIRYTDEGSEVLHNLRFTETRHDAVSSRFLRDRHEVVEVLAQRFGMPRAIVEELVADLPMRQDPYG